MNKRMPWVDPEVGSGGPDPLENYKVIEFLSNIDPDHLETHKATKPEYNAGPSSACQRNAIQIKLCLLADTGTLVVLFGSSLLLQSQFDPH